MASLLDKQKWQESMTRRYNEMEEENDKLKYQLKAFLHKYENLLHETDRLKDELTKVKEGFSSSLPSKASLDSPPREMMSFRSSVDGFKFGNMDSPFRVKKMNALNFCDQQKSSEFGRKRDQMNPNVKSLDRIKEKIRQLKDELVS